MPDTDLRDDSVLSYHCAITPDALWLLRRLFEQWLGERHVVADDAEDLVVIVNELCTAAVLHCRGEEIEVIGRLVGADMLVEVVGHKPSSPVSSAEISLARSMTDELSVQMGPSRTTLTGRRRVAVDEDRVPNQTRSSAVHHALRG